MKIASQPIACIPPYVKKQADKSPLPDRIPAKNNPPLGGSVYRIPSFGESASFPLHSKQIDQQQLAQALLRFLSNRVAEHYGQNAVLAKNAIWLCFDLKSLRDKMRESGADKTENMIQATELFSDLLNTVALVPKLDRAAGTATAFYYFAEVGEQFHSGGGSFDATKFVRQNAGDDAGQEIFDLVNDVLKKL
jgi:hypothetical protein